MSKIGKTTFSINAEETQKALYKDHGHIVINTTRKKGLSLIRSTATQLENNNEKIELVFIVSDDKIKSENNSIIKKTNEHQIVDVDLAVKITKLVDSKTKDSPHDIGMTILELIEKSKNNNIEDGVYFAKYEQNGKDVLINGHTMFTQDIVRDLNRKSYLEKFKILKDAERKTCEYNFDEDESHFETQCDEVLYWDDVYSMEELEKRRIKYCPFCGGEIV